jgi:bifunctional enzyme CysN/CysC
MSADESRRNIVWQHGSVARDARSSRGATIWFTGLSGSGKSTIAAAVEAALVAEGRPAYLLDGDNVRHGLNSDLGFSADDRAENVRRVAHVAQLMADAGLVTLVPVISPFRAGRQFAREIHAAAQLPFVEVWVSTPIDECERRDPKGLYAKARSGQLAGFTGVDDEYQEPQAPELILRADQLSVSESVARVIAALALLVVERL